jgi:uncharacterized membrane protein YfcA
MEQGLLLCLLFFVAAALYGSVGHAGASAYLAMMALVGMAPAAMKPTALVLNILAATIVTVQFGRAGYFSWRLFWPFAVASIPCSFLGGATHLPVNLYKQVVGVILVLSALRMIQTARRIGKSGPPPRPPHWGVAFICGGVLGFLAGLTGTGGGIFLTPLLLLMNWSETRTASGVSAAFILVNSIFGLAGNLLSVRNLTPWTPEWLAAAGIGALLGSQFGSRRFAPATLRYLLALVLVVAGGKLILV